ncbi:MAG: BamA/TamA family outer membrane protein [Pseudomonadota bacterium]
MFETIFLEDIKHFTDRDVIATTGLETGVATRLTFNGRQRLTPGGLAIRTTFELGDCVGLGRDNPRISERFTLGGANLRGFERSTNSPRDTCLSCAPGGGNFVTILSGHYYAVARTDLLVPIFKKLPQLETFAFFDIGSVWDEQTNTPAAGILDDGADLCMSYGIGTSFDTGLGKFEAYLALGSEGEVFDEEQDLARLSELNFRGN